MKAGDRVYAHPNHRNCGQHVDCGPGEIRAVYDDGTCHVALDDDPTGLGRERVVFTTTTDDNGGDPPVPMLTHHILIAATVEHEPGREPDATWGFYEDVVAEVADALPDEWGRMGEAGYRLTGWRLDTVSTKDPRDE